MEVANIGQLFVNSCEQLVPAEGVLSEGSLPPWLTGSLYRCGPGQFDLGPDFTLNHWFDGLGMICRISFTGDGRVFLQKRFVQSSAYTKAQKNGRNVYTEFGTRTHSDPSRNFIVRCVSTILPTDMTDNTSHNIYLLNRRLFVAGETSLIYNFDPFTLETGERVDLHSELGVHLCSSHPLQDCDESYNFLGVAFLPVFKYKLLRVQKHEQVSRAHKAFSNHDLVACKYPASLGGYSYYHTFSLTANYCIFMEMPLILGLYKIMMMVLRGKTIRDCLEWRNELKVKFHVIRKSDGQLLGTEYVTSEPFFQAHMINSYEVDDFVVLDMVTYENDKILDSYLLCKLRANLVDTEVAARVTRIVLPINFNVNEVSSNANLVTVDHTCAQAKYDDGRIILTPDHYPFKLGMDFPSINPKLKSRPYRYAYFSGLFDQGILKNSVGRLDMEERKWSTWSSGSGCFPSEPVFVPRAADCTAASTADLSDGLSQELDGVVLTAVSTVSGGQDCIAVIDPSSMTTLAKVSFSQKIPFLIHGLWLSAAELDCVEKVPGTSN